MNAMMKDIIDLNPLQVWLTVITVILWVFIRLSKMKEKYNDERMSSLEKEMDDLRNHVNRILK